MLVSIEARKRRPPGGDIDVSVVSSTAAPLESVLDPTNMGSFGEKKQLPDLSPKKPWKINMECT